MGWKIVLQDEGGKEIESIEDRSNLLAPYLPRNNTRRGCLRYVDPYGDTVFNRAQMQDILEELQELSAGASEGARGLLHRISDLVRRGVAEPHLYLKFVGD